MAKPHKHLLLPRNDWIDDGFAWCLRWYGRLSPRATSTKTEASCPACLDNLAAAEADLGHPLGIFAQLQRLRRSAWLDSPREVAALGRHIAQEQQEVMMCLFANNKLRHLHSTELYRGTLDAMSISPREIFKLALQHNAYGFVIVHNHPSGDVVPSTADLDITRQLIDCSKLMAFHFLDHIIVGTEGYCSLREDTTLWPSR